MRRPKAEACKRAIRAVLDAKLALSNYLTECRTQVRTVAMDAERRRLFGLLRAASKHLDDAFTDEEVREASVDARGAATGFATQHAHVNEQGAQRLRRWAWKLPAIDV